MSHDEKTCVNCGDRRTGDDPAMAEWRERAHAFQMRHVKCSQGTFDDGVPKVTKHDAECEYPNEHVFDIIPPPRRRTSEAIPEGYPDCGVCKGTGVHPMSGPCDSCTWRRWFNKEREAGNVRSPEEIAANRRASDDRSESTSTEPKRVECWRIRPVEGGDKLATELAAYKAYHEAEVAQIARLRRVAAHAKECWYHVEGQDRREALRSALLDLETPCASEASPRRRCMITRDVYDHPIVKGVRCLLDAGHDGEHEYEPVPEVSR